MVINGSTMHPLSVLLMVQGQCWPHSRISCRQTICFLSLWWLMDQQFTHCPSHPQFKGNDVGHFQGSSCLQTICLLTLSIWTSQWQRQIWATIRAYMIYTWNVLLANFTGSTSFLGLKGLKWRNTYRLTICSLPIRPPPKASNMKCVCLEIDG